MDNKKLKTQINQFWDEHITLTLFDYIKIPNKSPAFDKDWKENGQMNKVLDMAKSWADKHLPSGAELLGEKYPDAQFVITGVLGPNSNAHGPNEFLHIPYAKKLTCCIASIINDFN